jgi:predicted HTH transcriptional regulator
MAMSIHIHPIKKLISEGEHQQLDFKFEISDARKIAKSLVAFANTDGGRLLIGVKDNGKVAGVRSDEELYMIEAAASMYCKPEIKISSQHWNVDGRTVLEIWVDESDQKPHYACDDKGKWWVYVRSGDQNLLAPPVLYRAMRMKNSADGVFMEYSDKESLLINYLNENDSITLQRYMQLAHLTRKEATEILARMLSLHVISVRLSENDSFYSLKNNILQD